MWFWQALLGLLVAGAVLVLSSVAVVVPDERRRLGLAAAIGWLALAFAPAAIALALANWWPVKDWTHQLWVAIHPQIALFTASGAFLVARERAQGGSTRARAPGPAVLLAALLALALVPAALMQWAPNPNAMARNVGRPFAGTLEVLVFGLGGPMPASLVPENAAGLMRGMGYLPREITVPLGALSAWAVLWILVCAIQFAGAWLRPARLRHAFYLLAPFAALLAALRPMPFGIQASSAWESDPMLMSAFGPLVVLAVCASAAMPLAARIRRARRRRSRPYAERHASILLESPGLNAQATCETHGGVVTVIFRPLLHVAGPLVGQLGALRKT